MENFKLKAGKTFISSSSKNPIKILILKVSLKDVRIQRTGQAPESLPLTTALYNIKQKLWLS